MASELPTLPLQHDSIDDLLFVQTVIQGNAKYRGYRRDYLARNLSEMEECFVICKVCSGIMREASIYRGETTCLLCSTTYKRNAVNSVQNSVAKLEIKCPVLRDCEWKGNIPEAENHLRDCNIFLIKCIKCAQILPRREAGNHNDELCPMRKILCNYGCYKSGFAKDLEKHEKHCSKFPVLCQNVCGAEFARSFTSEHISVCELEEVACPFAEYGCKAKVMLRSDLLAHKKENLVEHTDLSLSRIKQIEIEKKSLECAIMTIQQLDGVEWKIPCSYKDSITFNELLNGPIFYNNRYNLRLYVCVVSRGKSILSRRFLGFNFSIERIVGEFDKQLGQASITNYRVITVNNQDPIKPLYEEGTMNYQLNIGGRREFYTINYAVCERYFAGGNSLRVRFYFEINTQPILRSSEVMPCSTEIEPQVDSDPFSDPLVPP